MKSKNFYKNKKVLVAGGTGLVGQPLVRKLLKLKAKVYIASKDKKNLCPKGIIKFYNTDLTTLKNCILVTKDKDIVFNLLGITGSPLINKLYPASFMMGNLNLALNMLEASRLNKVKNYLFTSTYGVYGPDLPMLEKNVWKTFPSDHDKYAGWAKRISELQVEAYRKEFNFKGLHIVRPGNIFGPFSNFNPKNSMVVSSLIKRVIDKENPLIVWGDGSAIRDFIFSEDVAESMIRVVQKNIQEPINIGSGKGYSIKQLVKTICKSQYLDSVPKILFDKSKLTGDKKRVLNTAKAKKNNIIKISNFQSSIDKTIIWYKKNKSKTKLRFNFFK